MDWLLPVPDVGILILFRFVCCKYGVK